MALTQQKISLKTQLIGCAYFQNCETILVGSEKHDRQNERNYDKKGGP